MKDFLKLSDFSNEEIIELLNHADQLKYEQKHGMLHPALKGQTLAMVFETPSVRTRMSFEVGMYQLGGHAIFMSIDDLQINRGDPIEDTARVIERYCDGVMIRTANHSVVQQLANYSNIPVINGMTSLYHPCQVLADLMTIREYKGVLEGRKICFLGAGNNISNSLIVGGLKVGMNVSVATPPEYMPNDDVMKFASNYEGFSYTEDVLEAAADADVVVTDVWASMGEEREESERRRILRDYQLNDSVMSVAKSDCIVQHCLPARRSLEITSEVLEKHAGEIFDEAENRLHVQKAILIKLMGKSL